MANLYSAGVSDVFLDFLNSYLEPRLGRVTVEGAFSETFSMCDMVFQGTVLGPSLRNIFFRDVGLEASAKGGKETLFATMSMLPAFCTSAKPTMKFMQR